MANVILYQAAWNDRGNVLTTQLDALADDDRSDVGAEIDNGVNLDTIGKVELNVDPVGAMAADATVEIHMVTAPDNSNFQDGSDSADPGPHTLVAVIKMRAVATPQRVMSPPFPLEPAKTKFLLLQRTGTAWPATDTTLKLYTANEELQ